MADAMEWIVCSREVTQNDHYHYLDNIVVLGPRDAPECAQALDIIGACVCINPSQWPSLRA